jgi:hypothetical protein
MFRKFLLQVVFLVIAGFAVDLKAQTGGTTNPGFHINIINPKGCLDADPETAELDSCPAGQTSPWTSCPTGRCDLNAASDTCKIPDQNINFSQWVHFTNSFYYNPPEAAPGATGKAAVEVDRTLCSYFRQCPCKRLPGGGVECTLYEAFEDWLIKYERSNSVICIGAPGAGGGSGGGGPESP